LQSDSKGGMKVTQQMPPPLPPESSKSGKFPTTHWTLVKRLQSDDAAERTRALDSLCLQYHYPLYCYIRRHGLDHHDAQDVLHDFLAKLLRLDSLATADAEKGRLRSFLLTSLQRFLITWERGQQRHRVQELTSLTDGTLDRAEDRYQQEELTETDTPDLLHQRKWASELMRAVLNRLRVQYEERNRGALFEALRPVLMDGGSLKEEGSAALAAQLGITQGNLRISLMRMLDDYRRALRDEILETVRDREEAREEFQELMRLFQK
jgi:RNA polymerase sigma-70 factor (ECF subfamily)